MDFDLKKYWWLILAVVVVLFLVARKSSAASTGSGTDYTIQAAQMATAQQQADQAARYGLVQSILNYSLATTQEADSFALNKANLDQQPQLINAQYANQLQLANLQASAQQYQINAASQLQQYQSNLAYNMQRRNDWLNAISTGIQTIVPNLFMNATNGNIGNIGLGGGSQGGYIFH